MNILLAALPLILILVLMVGFHWGASKAGALGWLSSILIAALAFGAGSHVLFWAQVQGFFRAVYVLYIIWGALLFFRVTEANGTLESVSSILQRLAPGRLLQVLLLGWGFTSFLQGVGGFGVPIAVVAPMLVSMKFSPIDAVVMASVGYGWAISFGSLGTAYEALITATGVDAAVVAPLMAMVLGVICVFAGFGVLWIAGGKEGILQEFGPWLTMALGMGFVQYLAVRLQVPNIAAMLGSLAGLIIGSGWAVARRRSLPDEDIEPISLKASLLQVLPYALLIAVIFAVSFIPFLNNNLNRLVLSVRVPSLRLADGTIVPATQTKGISIFGHSGAQLAYAGVLVLGLASLQGSLPPGSGAQIRRGVLRSGVKSTLGIMAMMAMATTMQISGMVTALSTAMAGFAGNFFPLIAPFIGALGSFMTGSNTNSNVLFGAFQQQVAQTLNLYVPLLLAFHNAGAALGSVFSPAKIIVGCSTVGASGVESAALRRTLQYGFLILVVVALLSLVSTRVL